LWNRVTKSFVRVSPGRDPGRRAASERREQLSSSKKLRKNRGKILANHKRRTELGEGKKGDGMRQGKRMENGQGEPRGLGKICRKLWSREKTYKRVGGGGKKRRKKRVGEGGHSLARSPKSKGGGEDERSSLAEGGTRAGRHFKPEQIHERVVMWQSINQIGVLKHQRAKP